MNESKRLTPSLCSLSLNLRSRLVSLTVQSVDSYNLLCGMLDGGSAPASGNNSVVECDLAKVEVVGSNPISRSINFSNK